MKLTYEKLDPTLPDLKYAHEGDAGFDLCVSLPEYQPLYKGQVEVIPTGYRFNIPDGYELQIRPRSSQTKRGVIAQFGTVDSGYRGELKVSLLNVDDVTAIVLPQERIAQAVLAPVTRADLQQGVVDTNTERGTDGFGSTGR